MDFFGKAAVVNMRVPKTKAIRSTRIKHLFASLLLVNVYIINGVVQRRCRDKN